MKTLESVQKLARIYALGLWSKAEIIQWCDKLIEVSDNPPYEVMEIFLFSKAKVNDIEGALFAFSSKIDEEGTVNVILAVIYEKLKENELTIEESITCTTRLLVNRGLYWEDGYFDLYTMDDSYDLAKNGVHFDVRDVSTTYIETLSVYRTYFKGFEKLYAKVMKQEWDRKKKEWKNHSLITRGIVHIHNEKVMQGHSITFFISLFSFFMVSSLRVKC